MERQGTELPLLIGQTGPLNGQRWTINQTLVIGRDQECNIVIPERQVSRYHLRLIPDTQGVLLEDLGSKNGTFHNGVMLQNPVILQDGDLIQVALIQHFVFLSSDATMPLTNQNMLEMKIRPYKLYLDPKSRRVWIGNTEVLPPLSVPQFRLLQCLYEQQGKVVTREEIMNTIWGAESIAGVSEQALDALVRRLRDRLVTIDPSHAYLITVRGHGLRLDNPKEK